MKAFEFVPEGMTGSSVKAWIHDYEGVDGIVQKSYPAVIVCPGGGYGHVSAREAEPIAIEYYAAGYNTYILTYTVGEGAKDFTPLKQLAATIAQVRANAEIWLTRPDQIAVCGFSAGGHLAASFGTENMGYLHYGLPKPGALILTYPVVTMGEKAHEGSRNFLLGENPSKEAIAFASIEQQITEKYPPTFLWWGDSDTCVNPDNSRMLKAALEEKHIPCECIEYAGVEHGVGIGKGLPCEGWFEKAVAFWEEHRA